MTPNQLKQMTDTPEKQEHILIEYIRAHAYARYNQGWGYVVEQWSDGDILEALSDAYFNLPQTLRNIQNMVDAHSDHREAQSN